MSMGIEIGETLIDYLLLNDIEKAVKAKVIKRGDVSENENRNVSLLDELMKPLDDKEVFVVVRNLVKYHRKDLIRVLEYMNKQYKEGEQE